MVRGGGGELEWTMDFKYVLNTVLISLAALSKLIPSAYMKILRRL